jgi:hypothetical protein
MHLMVYAPYGRAGIYMLQEFCRRIGIQASDDEIRDLVVARGALPAAHPLARLLRDAPDFRQEAALADALLNPQDRAYSVPQLSTGRNTWSTPSMGSAASARSLTMSNAMSAVPCSSGSGGTIRLCLTDRADGSHRRMPPGARRSASTSPPPDRPAGLRTRP